MRKTARTTYAFWAVTIFACTAVWPDSVHAELTIVEGGRPRAVILIPDDGAPVAYEAAEELARVIEKASGARLAIYPESEYRDLWLGYPARAAARLVLGNSKLVKEAGLDLSQLPPEGFAMKTVGQSVILAGRDEPHVGWATRGLRLPSHTRGTWHAVCVFLEDYLGVRWLWPGELGEVVPRTDNISIPQIDRQEAPALRSRILRPNCFYGSGWHNAALELGLTNAEQFAMSQELDQWSAHQRLDSSLTIGYAEFGMEWLEEFGQDHPEWFALQPNGQRLLTTGGGYRVRMCLSNPQVIDEAVRRVVAYLDEHPQIDGFGIAPSDVYGSYCVCNNCQAWGPTTSDLVARHAAAVAERVEALRPDKLVHALAYHEYVAPPESEVVLPDNVALSYVGIWYFGYLCDAVHQQSVKYWGGWAKVASKMIWRPNNFCFFSGVPRVYVTKLANDFRHFYNNNLVGVDFDRLGPHWAVDGLNYYAAARLAWNPETAPEEIVGDYCQAGFGAAAPAVREYFAELEKMTNEVAALCPAEDSYRDHPVYYDPEKLAALRGTLERAEDLTGGDALVRRRIALLRAGLDFGEIEVILRHAMQEAGEQKPAENEIARYRQLLARRRELLEDLLGSWAVDVVTLAGQQSWLEEQLFVSPQPGTFDDLPNAYDEIMELPARWRFRLDPEFAGEKEQWFAGDYDDSEWQPIRVGQFWEKQGYEGYDGAGWYRLRVKLPADLAGKQVELCFGAADEVAHVWVNGRLAGAHDLGPEGWDKRFTIDITNQMKGGRENLIAVRVYDSTGAGGLWKPIKVITPRTALVPTKDVWLRRSMPEQSNGNDPSLAVGAEDNFRSVLLWQLPENLGNVAVQQARLVLALRYHTAPASYAVYPFAQDFYEPKVDWNTSDGATPWAGGAGAQAALSGKLIARATLEAISAEQVQQTPTPLTMTFDVTELLKNWPLGQPPYGIIVVQDQPRKGATLSFHSRDASQAELRPRLEIDYSLSP